MNETADDLSHKDIIQIKNLTVRLIPDQVNILDNVSFSIKPGEIYGLVGQSGSGKSMTSLSIMRLLPNSLNVSKGNILFKDVSIFKQAEQSMENIRGAKISMIFQNALTSLNPVQKVGQQIIEVLKLHKDISDVQALQQSIELLEEVGLPEANKRVEWYPHQLSGGQQQRVMIAMALACNPDLLIADEPTTALDVTIQKKILELISSLSRSRKLAVLFITHDMGVIRQMADRIGVMLQGKIIEEKSAQEFFDNPENEYSKKLIEYLPRFDVFRDACVGDICLEVNDLKVHFPLKKGILQRTVSHTKAVDGVSFDIKKGETLALVGESGSGKSTIGKAILNLSPSNATSGKILYKGSRIDDLNKKEMLPYRRFIQVIFQNPQSSMNPRMTVRQIIEEGMVSLGLELNEQQRLQRIKELLDQVKLGLESLNRYPHEFSGGQQQRVAIARALAVEPDLIICDEPTSALDVATRSEVLSLLLAIQKDVGVSFLFITHDLSIVPHLAHRVAVMHAGKFVEFGETRQVLTAPQNEYTKTLIDAIPRI